MKWASCHSLSACARLLADLGHSSKEERHLLMLNWSLQSCHLASGHGLPGFCFCFCDWDRVRCFRFLWLNASCCRRQMSKRGMGYYCPGTTVLQPTDHGNRLTGLTIKTRRPISHRYGARCDEYMMILREMLLMDAGGTDRLSPRRRAQPSHLRRQVLHRSASIPGCPFSHGPRFRLIDYGPSHAYNNSVALRHWDQ